MYLLYVKNRRTGKWVRFDNSHTASLSGPRYGRPSRTMRFGGVARAYARSFRREGWQVHIRKVG
ncbi:hypothetical protein [Chloroflexus sp.]|uniref:hypothetical protein n=1 Tax=Chloroflexus sp. TaxID=1904827 RepID=UPI002ACDC296|nr:hypothetical protein [Chloroflexus sp.]